ncbi:MAG: hypothetical protein GOVbin2917_22 [Prokaryotic dsDNA virus sp.]|jgi:glutaredoxin|nr:MAG: hypothetical protein GOVbin2917_22 [Prokaryotic dsDNA virus sp.]|tara:strand:- start:91421 stop:91633 length:213 start_codon:yes stop_codon:yes gene_type:complete
MKLATASWCVNCTPVKKYIEKHKLNIELLDIDKDMDEARKAGVRSIPALILEGKVSHIGAEQIINYLEEK